MRYESFYPFARNQSPTQQTRQSPPGFNQFQGPPQNQGQQSPFQGLMGQMGQMPRQGAPGPQQGPGARGPGPAGGGTGALASKMDTYMATANQFFNTAQQFAPVVQQFAPMVRNLPAMWRLYKGFQSLPDAGAGPSPQTGGSTRPTAPPSSQGGAQAPRSNVNSQPSVPRIFQPPNLEL